MTAESANAASVTDTKPSKALHIGLWVVQVLLAAGFGMAGAMKTMTPIDELATKLTVFAAEGLALIMVLATGFHAYRGELGAVPITLIIGGLAVFVAWGRHTKAPIKPRG